MDQTSAASSNNNNGESMYKFINITLSLTSQLTNDDQQQITWNKNNSPCLKRKGGYHADDNDDKGKRLKNQWDLICRHWGMLIVRELVYIQNTILEEDLSLEERQHITSTNNAKKQLGELDQSGGVNTSKNNNIVIDGCEATKVRDHLVVSEIVPSTPAQKAGILPGDIIHAIYGMNNPKLPLLFGIMRDSTTFQLTIKRNNNTNRIYEGCHCVDRSKELLADKNIINGKLTAINSTDGIGSNDDNANVDNSDQMVEHEMIETQEANLDQCIPSTTNAHQTHQQLQQHSSVLVNPISSLDSHGPESSNTNKQQKRDESKHNFEGRNDDSSIFQSKCDQVGVNAEKDLILGIEENISESESRTNDVSLSTNADESKKRKNSQRQEKSSSITDVINDRNSKKKATSNLLIQDSEMNIRKEFVSSMDIIEPVTLNEIEETNLVLKGVQATKIAGSDQSRPRLRSLSEASSEIIANRMLSKSGSNSPMFVDGKKTLSFVPQPSSNVVSTSSVAGLSVAKNTKLKRLWPDSFIFAKQILKWCPPKFNMTEKGDIRFYGPIKRSKLDKKLDLIPSTFRDSPDIIKHMKPHILEEGINGLQQEFLENSDNNIWKRPWYKLFLRNCTPVEPKSSSSASVRLHEFAFQIDPNNTRPPTNLGEIFAVYSPNWNQTNCCLGFIGSNDINSTFLMDQKTENENSFDLCKLWISVSSKVVENSGWLPEAEMPSRNSDGSFSQQVMYAINIGTCTDMMRQYEALKSLDCIKTHLRRAVFCDHMENYQSLANDTSGIPQPSKPSSVIQDVWEIISKQTNPFQLSAIEKVMMGKSKENITLLQGPPGTGKTLTVVALVSALLNGSVPVSGSKNRTTGTKVQIGKALSSSQNTAILKAPVARRILICSPSNQSVDELAWKLHRNAIGTDGRAGSFNIIRFGMLPDEERHDGRGKSQNRNRGKSTRQSSRDKFLYDINLDLIINKIADGREVNDYAHHKYASTSKSGSNRHSRFINYSVERQKKLSECHIICTTLSGAGSKAFADAVSRDEFPQSEFDAVIIDEACQGSEMACLIPFKFNPNVVILVGDPNQLPVMTFSQDAERCKADRSLFERLRDNGWPVHMLRYQYRMHEAIASFPSRMFYENRLITSESVQKRDPAPWHKHKACPPYLFWNIGGTMKRSNQGGLSNQREVEFVLRLLCALRTLVPGLRNVTIGVIAFYNNQVSLINDRLQGYHRLMNWMKKGNITIQVSTVDGFQGSEKDIIILSCVRSRWHGRKNIRNEIGFLKDFRRVNVALTRAKYSLWILGNCDVLSCDELWNSLIDDARSRQLLTNTCNLDIFMAQSNRYMHDQHHHKEQSRWSPSKKHRK